MSKIVDVDFLILGSGIAGLYCAYQLAEFGEVLLITKAEVDDANTTWAQGGIASVLAGTDSFEKHIQDTLDAGAGLCDPEAVRILCTEGPEHVRRLIDLGAHFEHDESGQLHLGREGGHSENRIVHAADLTGKEVEHVMWDAVRKRGIRIWKFNTAVELITRYHLTGEYSVDRAAREEPTCFGAYIYDRVSWDIYIVRARATILATGGAGQVYRHNTNPEVATGDGVALAYRAGAEIMNMEFYQFHPTSLYLPGAERTFLISEALRGFGAQLLGPDKQRFMPRYDERGELAPRDIVARAIDAEMKRTGSEHVWLDVRHRSREELMAHFPNIFSYCLDHGIDISRQLIPVVPAAHYMCGGVRTDLHGRTNLRNLFALGEVGCTGVHGGNRLASNSLLEGLVFAARIAVYLRGNPPERLEELDYIKPWQKDGLHNAEEWILVQHNFDEIRKIMSNYVGILRSNLRLNRARRRIKLLHDEIEDFYRRTIIQNKILELRNIALLAGLIVDSAAMRKESRGLHFTTDYPENRAPSRENTIIRRPPA